MDNRIQNLIRITDPNPTGRTRVAGAWRGARDGKLHSLMLEVTRATEGLLRTAYDIRGNRNFGPVETGTRLREAAGPAMKVLNDVTSKFKAEKASLREQVLMLNPVQGYKDCGHWQAQFDLRLIDWYHALPLGKRSAIEHDMRAMPGLHLDLAEALLRVPRELAGISEEVRADMKLGLLKLLRSTEFHVLDERLEQLATTEAALRIGIETARDTSGSLSDLMEHAPAAFSFFTNPDDAKPVSWLPPHQTELESLLPARAAEPVTD